MPGHLSKNDEVSKFREKIFEKKKLKKFASKF